MDPSRFDRLFRTLGTATGRRTLLQSAAALGTALVGGAVLPDAAAAKTLCRKNGASCKKKGKRCRAAFCLKAPFTIEARWSNAQTDHDTYLFVPNKAGSNDPSPVLNMVCNPAQSNCENDIYPFTCVNKDAVGPGDEITTVRRFLAGRYEYWVELAEGAPAGDLKVLLRNANGRVIRSWSSPKNPYPSDEPGWHVFDIDGATRGITSINALTDHEWPWTGHNPFTSVCPGVLGFP